MAAFSDIADQLSGQIDLQKFLSSYQDSIDRLFPEILTHLQLTEADLETPEKKPASQA